MNRRRLLLGGLGILAVAGVGAWGFGPMAARSEIAAVLRRRLAFLRLDDAGVHAFARDQVSALLHKRIPTLNRLRYHFTSAVAPSFQRYYRSTDHRSRIARMEDALVSMYLLSSDFFLNGADESKTVNYIAFYDPLHPCGNPFARPVVVNS